MTCIPYLMASLPSLTFPEPPPISREAFFEACRPWLSTRAFRQVLLAGWDIQKIPPADVRHPLLKKWLDFESTLRNELALLRSRRMGVDAAPFIRPEGGFEGPVKAFLANLSEAKNPLDAEMRLLRFRWDFLIDETALHYFDLSAVLGYALKIGILARAQVFDRDKGRKKLQFFFRRQDDERPESGNNTRR